MLYRVSLVFCLEWFTESDTVICRFLCDGEIDYAAGIFTEGKWDLYHSSYCRESEDLQVTHWRPLPELSETKGENHD
ncbi:MAG: DUF551 domain-containing protein [Oscillospiraceae bacterium]|nr:DUF551 domain-containing protein [Oscillospiraceae bacterium]